jgi:hypothetical protein
VETGSKKAAYTALIDDLGIAIAKLIAAIFTGSIAMDTYNSNQYHVKKTLVNDPKKADDAALFLNSLPYVNDDSTTNSILGVSPVGSVF